MQNVLSKIKTLPLTQTFFVHPQLSTFETAATLLSTLAPFEATTISMDGDKTVDNTILIEFCYEGTVYLISSLPSVRGLQDLKPKVTSHPIFVKLSDNTYGKSTVNLTVWEWQLIVLGYEKMQSLSYVMETKTTEGAQPAVRTIEEHEAEVDYFRREDLRTGNDTAEYVQNLYKPAVINEKGEWSHA